MSEEAVRLGLVKHGLIRFNLPPVKSVQRFVGREPNELWQVDIMDYGQGEISFGWESLFDPGIG